ncbi:MAG: 50S ribosomal protein L4 [Deltaproteobacteria bacterium]|nr:MAG: 50S ribosomal protein L4 [Deltaproteobacteria bacterium]
MNYDVVNIENEKVGEIQLDEGIFDCEVKPHLIHEVVRMQRAARRRGTASVKNRHLVRGGGKKPYRQKGTGRARQGSIRSPHYRGGGVVFGPTPRSYAFSVPKKIRKAALRSALTLKRRSEQLKIVDAFELPEIKTKRVAEILARFERGKTLIVTEKKDEILEKSARNIPHVKVLRVEGLNVYDLLKYDHLLLTQGCVAKIEGAMKR